MLTTRLHRYPVAVLLATLLWSLPATAKQVDIAAAQKLLLDSGYDLGEADGQQGPQTRSAVELFQQDYDLPPTGALDAKTLQRLEAMHRKMLKQRRQTVDESAYVFYGEQQPGGSKTATDEATAVFDEADLPEEELLDAAGGREFSLLAVTQEQLDELGYDPGNFEGDMTDATRAALKKFQKDNDIPTTGKADAATNGALNREMQLLKRRQIAEQKAAGNENVEKLKSLPQP